MSTSDENKNNPILVIDDETAQRRSAITALENAGYTAMEADSISVAIDTLENHDIDLVITDLHIGGGSGLEIIKLVKQSFPETETVLLTDYTSIESGGEAMQMGASDYVTRPYRDGRFLQKVQKTLERRKMRLELTALRQHVAMSYGFDNIVGISRSIIQLKETAQRIAPTDITTLITGASGTGKELFARAIHHHSERRNKRFVAIDCSTIPEALMESQLFGHRKSTDDSPEYKPGLFDEADGGTGYLDRINEMPMRAQTGLLQLLQNSEVHPVGCRESHKVDVRIIAACDHDLSSLVAQNEFRDDLYYRLNVIGLHLPRLAERAEDIEILTEYFLRKISGELKKPTLTISRQAVDRLSSYAWPGNVRELENTLKRGAALCTGDRLETEDIMFIAGDRTAIEDISQSASTVTLKAGLLDNSQRTLIIKALNNNGWNYTRTAAELGIGRTTLWRKIKKYSLKNEMSGKL
jgi:DNA-binding NtrC family response regulator